MTGFGVEDQAMQRAVRVRGFGEIDLILLPWLGNEMKTKLGDMPAHFDNADAARLGIVAVVRRIIAAVIRIGPRR